MVGGGDGRGRPSAADRRVLRGSQPPTGFVQLGSRHDKRARGTGSNRSLGHDYVPRRPGHLLSAGRVRPSARSKRRTRRARQRRGLDLADRRVSPAASRILSCARGRRCRGDLHPVCVAGTRSTSRKSGTILAFPASITATAVTVALTMWFVFEQHRGELGLAERCAAVSAPLWLLLVVLTTRSALAPAAPESAERRVRPPVG